MRSVRVHLLLLPSRSLVRHSECGGVGGGGCAVLTRVLHSPSFSKSDTLSAVSAMTSPSRAAHTPRAWSNKGMVEVFFPFFCGSFRHHRSRTKIASTLVLFFVLISYKRATTRKERPERRALARHLMRDNPNDLNEVKEKK